MNRYVRGFMERQLERADRPPKVSAMGGWRRFVRPTGVALVAALAGAGGALYLNNGGTSGNGASPSAAAQGNPVLADTRTVTVSVTDKDGCVTDRSSFPSGQLVVSIVNKDADGLGGVTLLKGVHVIGERESVPPGASASFTVTAGPGKYTLSCPGTGHETTSIDVTGSTVASHDIAALKEGAGDTFKKYAKKEAAALTASSEKLAATIADRNLPASQAAYADARRHYKRIDPDGLEELLGVEEVPEFEWGGIEKGLFSKRSAAGLTGDANDIVAVAQKYEALIDDAEMEPSDIVEGASDLLTAIFRFGIYGEEEKYSHYDLLDMVSQVEGAEAIFNSVKPALDAMDGVFTASITDAFASFKKNMTQYADPRSPSGYKSYVSCTPEDLTHMSHSVQNIVEPVSRIASKLGE